MTTTHKATIAPTVGWRFKCGLAILALKVVLALCIPVLAFSGLSAAKIAAITGAIFITNKLLLVVMIAVMGKTGFLELKRVVGGYLPSLKDDAPVSRARHAIGIFMFCFPIVSGMLEPYVDTIWPGLRPNIWQFQLGEDLMLIASVFVLGGNFWGKVRAVFVRTARVADAGSPVAA